MAWVAKNKNGSETIYEVKPYKYNDEWVSRKDGWERPYQHFDIPQGSIKKLIGRELTWNDEPVELKEE
jgi:hypothetical protein